VATIEGNVVTIVGKGTSTITATQASTTNYLSGSITATFIVRLTPVITNFSAITKTIGDASFSNEGPTTDSDGAFMYTSSNTAVATVSGTTITIVSAGTSTITATQSLTSNYVSGTITTTLTVNKATTVLSNFSEITKTFGNAAFSLVAPTTNSTGAITYTSHRT
jgi:Tfp pilus assembly protein FimT